MSQLPPAGSPVWFVLGVYNACLSTIFLVSSTYVGLVYRSRTILIAWSLAAFGLFTLVTTMCALTVAYGD